MTALAELRAAGNAPGIDISNNNGVFDFAAWPGLDFVWIKAVELTPGGPMYYDTQFARNWQQAWDVYDGKCVRVAYCFAHPGASLAAQVDTLVQFTRDHGLRRGDHLMMDLEVTDGESPASVARFGRQFCARANAKAPDHRCIDYTFRAFALEGNCQGQGPWRLALAETEISAPQVPGPWSRWSFWQYRQEPSPDRDVFNGTRQQLLDFAWMPADRR